MRRFDGAHARSIMLTARNAEAVWIRVVDAAPASTTSRSLVGFGELMRAVMHAMIRRTVRPSDVGDTFAVGNAHDDLASHFHHGGQNQT